VLDVNGWELIALIVVGILVLGPERLPEYAGKFANMVRQVRNLATNARTQLKDQMGPEFDDVDWRQFDPRQYDPRRIVREALSDADVDPADPLGLRGAGIDRESMGLDHGLKPKSAGGPGANGSVKAVTLGKTSGFRILDTQALIVVQRVSKLFVPVQLRGRDIAVTIPIGFYLQDM